MNRIPVAYLTCNGSPPVGDKPSLMTFREVETLFHEFGHGLQHMLTNVVHGEAAGISNVEWDAVGTLLFFFFLLILFIKLLSYYLKCNIF